MALKFKAFVACTVVLIALSAAPAAVGHGGGGDGGGDEHVDYVRNVEEVKGHLNASLTLSRMDDSDGASLHANHPPDDYLGVILPPVEDENPELAEEIESTLNEAPEAAEGDADEYADYISNDVHPLLNDAVETVVPEEDRNSPVFAAKVNTALLNRIDDEYTAAVAENGTVVLEGEYWDGRGFLNRIKDRHPELAAEFDDGTGSDSGAALEEMTTRYENTVAPSELKPTTLRLRVLYEAGVGTDEAVVDDGVEAVRFMRNAEEVKGHLESSVRLKGQEDPDGASLHAGHPTDYLGTLGPATYAADKEAYEALSEVAYGAGDAVSDSSPSEYESYVREEVFPAVDSAVDAAVPDEYRTTEARARVAAGLSGRLMEEYTAAVTEDGEVELEGEYWDGRGFLVRITEIHERELSGEMDEETSSKLTTTLEELRTKYENEVPPSELRPTAVRLQVLYEGGAGTDDAVIDDEVEGVRYMRNAEEVKGHLESSISLKEQDDPDGASLHAGHPTDYLGTLGPAAYAADTETWERLSEVSYATGDRVSENSPSEYESYVREEVFPAVDSAVDAAVPSEYRTTEARAQVAAELTDRLVEEYSAAVTEEGTVELEGEYWDGRGFLVRITEIHEGELSGEMDEETNEELSGALGDLRSSYEEEVPPSELEPAAEDVRSVLTDAGFGATEEEDSGEQEGDGESQDGSEGQEGDGEPEDEGTEGQESDGESQDGSEGQEGDGGSDGDSTEDQDTEPSGSDDGSATDGGDGDGDEADQEDGGQGMPGFTAVAALVAVVVAAAFLRE